MSDLAESINGYSEWIAESKTAAQLLATAAELLAENSDLPAPSYIVTSVTAQEVTFQFDCVPESVRSLVAWAQRFGGAVRADDRHGRDGNPERWYRVHFQTSGSDVELYAHVPQHPGTARS